VKKIEYGQWIGTSINDKKIKAVVTLNIEKRQPNLAQVLTHLPEFPSVKTVSTFQFAVVGDEMNVTEPDIRIIDTGTGVLTPIESYWKSHKSEEPLSKSSHFKFTKQGNILSGTSVTDTGISSVFDLANTVDEPPRYADPPLLLSQLHRLHSQP
jgi:hypothetical protein